MLVRALLSAVLAAALGLPLAGAESFEEMKKKTDMASADQVFALAQWCQENQLGPTANRYYNQVLKIDKDHEGARIALGFVRVDEKWVHQSRLAPAAKPAPGDPAAAPLASSAPTAAQIAWDLRIPKDPTPENDFITAYIEKLPRIPNESTEMDSAVATMAMEENFPMALPRLCAALARPDYGDVFGAAGLVMHMAKAGQIDSVRPLLGFLVKASERVTDAGDLEQAAYAIALFRDKRAIPRLIDMMDTPNDAVKQVVSDAIASLAALPPGVSKAKAQEWWAKNHDADPRKLYLDQLKSSDPSVQIEAASALYDLREKAMFPTVIKLLRSEDRHISGRALRLVKGVTGLDFNFAEAKTPEEKEKRIKLIEKWWKDNGERFRFPEPAEPKVTAPAAPAVDPVGEWVEQLGSVQGNTADQAEASLRSKGLAAVPALIGGLESSASIVRRKCHEILKGVTKQDLAFDPKGSDEERAKSVAAWRAWAEKNGHAGGEEPEQ